MERGGDAQEANSTLAHRAEGAAEDAAECADAVARERRAGWTQ